MNRPLSWLLVAAATMTMLVVGASAHTVPVERIVAIDASLASAALHVNVHLPRAAVSTALLAGATAPTGSELYEAVAADVVRNLDVRQSGDPIPPQSAAARQGATADDIDIDIAYPASTLEGMSARLNVFESTPVNPVKTRLRVRIASGSVHEVVIEGRPVRVTLAPTAWDAARDAAALAIDAVAGWSDQLLMAICIIVPLRRLRETARLVALLAAGQVAGMLLATVPSTGGPELDALARALTASAVVVAAIQLIVRARYGLVAATVGGFALLNGLVAGREASTSLQFAGGHVAVAVAVYIAAFVLIEVWAAAVLWSARAWLDGRGTPAWALESFVAVIVGHRALHHFADAGRSISGADSFVATHMLTAITLGWVLAALACGARRALPAPGGASLEPAELP
jgi:hypothetical protein